MRGGNIFKNTALLGGGVANQGQFVLQGGSIHCNLAHYRGGGVCNGGTFEMRDGRISQNETDFDSRYFDDSNSFGTKYNLGGGIFNSNKGSIQINGGIIERNYAVIGGGIYN